MQTIQPGVLVSLRTTLDGGARYYRTDLPTDPQAAAAIDARGTVATWQTTKVVDDQDEYDRAGRTRSQAGNLIRAACIKTSFGLVCPLARVADLDAAVIEAGRIVREFNQTARHSRIRVYTLQGRIADDDAEAARAIASEVAELIGAMQAGIESLNKDQIREAASRAKAMGAMLDEESARTVNEAVKAARSAARQIVKRIETANEDAQVVLADLQGMTGPIENARVAFLDLDDDTEPAEPVDHMPAVNVQRVASLLDELELSPAVEPETPEPDAPAGLFGTAFGNLDLEEESNTEATAANV